MTVKSWGPGSSHLGMSLPETESPSRLTKSGSGASAKEENTYKILFILRKK